MVCLVIDSLFGRGRPGRGGPPRQDGFCDAPDEGFGLVVVDLDEFLDRGDQVGNAVEYGSA